MDKKTRDRVLKRGVTEIIVESEFEKLLDSEKPLRLKMGFDPSAPDLHVGHAVGLRKLRQLQDLGHQVVVIVGDWTAQIGDPSGRSTTRPMLTAEQVYQNAETYLAQLYNIVDRDKTEVRMQSEWFGPFTLEDVVKLTSRFTVAQLLARDDFSKRFNENHPIAITELLYPLLQAYDSVAIEADVEFGGTDQKFNLLVGRELQQATGQTPQQCFIMPLLVGTDGVQKMSKSLNNYIALEDPPSEMYGKTMSLPDSAIVSYFETLTDVPDADLEEMKQAVEHGSSNPMDFKKRLARELVAEFHDAKSADEAESRFESTVQRGETPDNVPAFRLASTAGKRLGNVLVEAQLASSNTDAKRLINQSAVSVNGEPVTDNVAADTLSNGDLVRAGRRRMVRIERSE